MSSYFSSHDDYLQRNDYSKSHKLKNVFWTTKQAMITKFNRKQDENIVASDADLDAKLELLQSVEVTCRDLSNLLIRYQDTIYCISQCENEMGRFLKRNSLEDSTQAGKIMSAAGKALSHSAQHRLSLRAPLERTLQEVKTFRNRGISDTVSTLKRMESSRTQYRGALLWMKKVSEELDPDTYKQMEKFRSVQAHVKKSKQEFDRLKIDSMQKIDLLSASRCNMLSHVLAIYQNTLLTFFEKTSHAMNAVAERFRGYQYYEFSILKELCPESRKLAELDADGTNGADQVVNTTPKQDQLTEEELDQRLDDIFKADDALSLDQNDQTFPFRTTGPAGESDLLGDMGESKLTSEHRDLLDDLFPFDESSQIPGIFDGEKSCSGAYPSSFSILQDSNSGLRINWGQSPTASTSHSADSAVSKSETIIEDDPWQAFQRNELSALPSQMWDRREMSPVGLAQSQPLPKGPTANDSTSSNTSLSSKPATDLNAWMNLFSDFGQVGNPDTICKNEGQITDA